jgi:hypothetical protein
MTDEELDEARALEAVTQSKAYFLLNNNPSPVASARIAARLAREGWKPEDPLLKEAREIVQRTCILTSIGRDRLIAGMDDGAMLVRLSLAALKRGMELAKKGK